MHTLLRVFAIAMFFVLAGGTASSAATPDNGATQKESPVSEAPLTIFNRTIFVFRAPLMGSSPAVRAARARSALETLLRADGNFEVSVKDNPEERLMMVGETLMFAVAEADVNPRSNDSLDKAAKRAAEELRRVIAETQESSSVEAFIRCCWG